jgi:hypothetical protein
MKKPASRRLFLLPETLTGRSALLRRVDTIHHASTGSRGRRPAGPAEPRVNLD